MKIKTEKITKRVLKEVFKVRSPFSHKYDFGYLIVIGGNKTYSGSPALAGLSALKSGVDLVTIISPKRAADIVAGFSPNLITFPLEGDYLDLFHLSDLIVFFYQAKEVSKNKLAVVIGGGLGRNKNTLKTVNKYLTEISKEGISCVIDADAIHAVAKNKKVLNRNFLITPHGYEFFVLTGKRVAGKTEKERIKIVKEESQKLKTNILLKGNPDIVSDGRIVAVNRTGNPFMTVGGTGDILAGICGAILARQVPPFLAAKAASFINGRAGDIAAQKLKESLTATDVIEAIPNLWK